MSHKREITKVVASLGANSPGEVLGANLFSRVALGLNWARALPARRRLAGVYKGCFPATREQVWHPVQESFNGRSSVGVEEQPNIRIMVTRCARTNNRMSP